MQRCPRCRLHQQLRPIATGAALHRRRHRPEQFDPAQLLLGQQTLGGAACLIEETFGLPGLCASARNRAKCENGGSPAARRSLSACSAKAK